METKHVGSFECKNAERGEVQAIVARLNVADRDGDLIERGAIADGSKVAISSYGHAVVNNNAPPVGRGRLTTRGDTVVLDGKFFMSTHEGRESFLTVKELGTDQEWSFGYQVVALGDLTPELRRAGARRVLKRVRAIEVSPVLIGAGIGTATVSVKACVSCGRAEPCGCQCSHEPASLDLVAIRETLDRARFAVAAAEYRDLDQWARVDPERRVVAEKIATFACARLGIPSLDVKWRHLPHALGHFRPDEPGSISLDPDLDIEDVPAVVFHESVHAWDVANNREPWEPTAELLTPQLLDAWHRDGAAWWAAHRAATTRALLEERDAPSGSPSVRRAEPSQIIGSLRAYP